MLHAARWKCRTQKITKNAFFVIVTLVFDTHLVHISTDCVVVVCMCRRRMNAAAASPVPAQQQQIPPGHYHSFMGVDLC